MACKECSNGCTYHEMSQLQPRYRYASDTAAASTTRMCIIGELSEKEKTWKILHFLRPWYEPLFLNLRDGRWFALFMGLTRKPEGTHLSAKRGSCSAISPTHRLQNQENDGTQGAGKKTTSGSYPRCYDKLLKPRSKWGTLFVLVYLAYITQVPDRPIILPICAAATNTWFGMPVFLAINVTNAIHLPGASTHEVRRWCPHHGSSSRRGWACSGHHMRIYGSGRRRDRALRSCYIVFRGLLWRTGMALNRAKQDENRQIGENHTCGAGRLYFPRGDFPTMLCRWVSVEPAPTAWNLTLAPHCTFQCYPQPRLLEFRIFTPTDFRTDSFTRTNIYRICQTLLWHIWRKVVAGCIFFFTPSMLWCRIFPASKVWSEWNQFIGQIKYSLFLLCPFSTDNFREIISTGDRFGWGQ